MDLDIIVSSNNFKDGLGLKDDEQLNEQGESQISKSATNESELK